MSHYVISYLIPSHLSYHVVIYNVTLIYFSYGVMYGDLEKKRKGKTRTTEKNRREERISGEEEEKRRDRGWREKIKEKRR